MRLATGARVMAEDVALVTREGPVYTGVDFTARPGTLTVFQADSGGGRSALLLTLTGRMRPTSGTVYVDGHELPGRARRVRRISSLGLMTEVNALDERLRVREHLSEAALLRFRPAARGLADAAVEAAELADLDRDTMVKELPALERRRLGVALALMAEPRLLAVDDVDGGLSDEHQVLMWRTLKGLSDAGLTVIATCADADALVDVADADVQGPLPIGQGEEPDDPPEDPEEMRPSAPFDDLARAEGPGERHTENEKEKGGDHRDR
ncbi:ATP-binding cassette domain-containing protein [Nocardiopsis lambiniae]|uniref:ATP-binding cassette domain-containing protein n=1 Tax=Nocardiopsis lambiniae TaxID=3075539 RepID=A0ABU2M551_9ACTN|nr:ATP-binding cassette domain-containing protein [Nocardiopsis sp. DSM 44743]MDT0327745.1 ATP-binding cassette domain-containing protein [Nocardiopsis sp. DSM 44743]